MFLRSLSSEFPHDNPALSEGVVWTCPSPCAAAFPLREPDPPAPGALVFGPPGAVATLTRPVAEKPKPIVAVRPRTEEMAAPLVTVDVSEPARAVAEPLDPFSRLLRALSQVALNAGATRLAAGLPALFSNAGGATPDIELDATSRELVSVGLAWRDVLSGASSDLSACGARTLDEWGAELLCALLRRPRSESRDLRQKLRTRGVAAFGLCDAA